ncbi:MAG: DegT/DnrJ/EryC1/StrS family aminotransferase [Rivularia sp. (in: Bacteria)]|nr:DegT/DnrJ/EryC1/StrS family aminotransferase [Rivularia sp. MS3]
MQHISAEDKSATSFENESEIVKDKLAILGGTPVRTQPYPEWPVVDERDTEAVTKVIQSGQWGSTPYPGEQTAAFAKQFADIQGGGIAVPMVNGTVTMEVALRAANIGWGDEVIVPAYTFQATATAPMAAGAIPVIVDIDPDTYCISPAAIEAAITEKTRAIIPVHLGAQIADMDAIMKIAKRYNLIVIEDCAHAHGAQWKGKGVGTIGHFGSFSLQSSKILTTGEGGLLLCSTQELAQKVASIINCGRFTLLEKNIEQEAQSNGLPQLVKELAQLSAREQEQVFVLGTNYRMTEMQAALGNVALQRFPQQVEQREAMVDYLEKRLSEVPGIRLLKRDSRHTKRSFYRYIFALEPKIFGAKHDEVCMALYLEGIPCSSGYQAMHRYDLFQPQLSRLPVPSAFPEYFDFKNMSFPQAERACDREAVWLEESVFRAGKQGIDDVIKALTKIQSNTGALAVAKSVKNLAVKSMQLKPVKALMDFYVSRSYK